MRQSSRRETAGDSRWAPNPYFTELASRAGNVHPTGLRSAQARHHLGVHTDKGYDSSPDTRPSALVGKPRADPRAARPDEQRRTGPVEPGDHPTTPGLLPHLRRRITHHGGQEPAAPLMQPSHARFRLSVQGSETVSVSPIDI